MSIDSPAPPGKRSAYLADVCASLVVFMVALPLCVAIAGACGLPPEAGLVTGIVGGLLVGFLAGSPLQVSGPAAGLIVLIQDILHEPGGLERFGLTIFLAGLLQVGAGLLRVGQWFRAVSPAVVMGMLAGIGVIILAKQTHVLFDTPAPTAIGDALLAIPTTLSTAFNQPTLAGPLAAGTIGAAAILIIVGWSLMPRQVKLIPAAVVAVLAAALAVWAFGFDVARVQVSGLENGIRLLQWPGWETLANPNLWQNAAVVALIASAETLLCASAVDTKHTGPRTQYNRELIAQGIGNAVCGGLGVLPMTGVIVRSSANVSAGAKTRLSAILHGVWLLLFAALLPGMLGAIPTAALAAVLVVTGWKLLELPELPKLWKQSKAEAGVFVATCAGVVLTDLLTGVLIGLGLTAVRLLWLFSHLSIHRADEPALKRIHLHLDGAGTFLGIPKLAATLERLPPGREVHIHLDRLRFVDHAVLKHLTTFEQQYTTTGGTVYLDMEHLMARFHTVGEQTVPASQPKTPEVPRIDAASAQVTSKHQTPKPVFGWPANGNQFH